TVRALPLPLAPLDEAHVLLKLVEQAFTTLNAFNEAFAGQKQLLDTLNSAILAKAFRGELVPQDPNDEPASALLERIRAERESAVTTTPTKKTRAKRATKTSKRASG